MSGVCIAQRRVEDDDSDEMSVTTFGDLEPIADANVSKKNTGGTSPSIPLQPQVWGGEQGGIGGRMTTKLMTDCIKSAWLSLNLNCDLNCRWIRQCC